MALLTYFKFYEIFKNYSFQKLNKIYALLTKYELPIWGYAIFLNENLVFVKF